MTFEETYLNDNILDALYDMHFEQMTPIQEQCIPHILDERDLIGIAQTGTGKTAAYLLPILSMLDDGGYPKDAVNCIVMAPTRELAQQIDQAMQGFGYYLDGISSVAVYGGNDGSRFDTETRGLRMGADVVIATPGRLLSHLRMGHLDLSQLSFFVLDACFSGSFPGIDLAAVCAADAMGLRIVYSAAVGASFYGANIPEYTAPEMLMTAYEAGLIGAAPALVTMGGENDAGANMTGALMEETEEIEAVKARLAAEGLAVTPVASLDEAVRLRLGICGNPAAFVNVGGNVAGIGRNAFALENSYGILAPQRIRLNEGSGLMEYYLNEGIPVISFLNIKKLCLEYGIAFDPDRLPEPGTEGVYYERRYDRGLIAAAGAVTFAALILIEKDRKKSLREKEKH